MLVTICVGASQRLSSDGGADRSLESLQKRTLAARPAQNNGSIAGLPVQTERRIIATCWGMVPWLCRIPSTHAVPAAESVDSEVGQTPFRRCMYARALYRFDARRRSTVVMIPHGC